MGCSGSVAGNAGASKQKKFDDNKCLRENGLQPMNKPQLAAFEPWWKQIIEDMKAGSIDAESMASMGAITTDETVGEAIKKLFDQLDEDSDGKLNKEEGIQFIKNVNG